jgi:dolichyldiphosphatase
MIDSDSIAFDATHVLYNKGDKLGAFLAVISLAPQSLLIVYSTLIFSRREIETILMFGGQVGCELMNEYLKRTLKQDRPKCTYM